MRYAIGLDVGISSVGYSVLELNAEDHPCRIEKLGSRIFDKAENPKDGSSLAIPRREARSARRRLRRHRHRLERIRGLIVSSKILTKDELETLYDGILPDVYEIRTKALDEQITPKEFARIMIHLAQRRGYQSNRKSEAKEEDTGKMLGAVSENAKRCAEHGYRTIGEMFFKDEAFAQYKRNKQDNYIATVDRASVEREARMIFAVQRQFCAAFATEEIETAYLDILLGQRSFADGPACGPYSGNQVERMRGYCTFETGEVRAAKASYTFQLFNLWQHINHIRIETPNGIRSLTSEERQSVSDLAHQKKEISFAQIRKKLCLAEEDRFIGVRYDKDSTTAAEGKKKLNDLKVYHDIRKCVSGVSKEAFVRLTHEDLDAIGEALCKNQSDEQITSELTDAGISMDVVEALLELPNFPKFGHLSIKACKKILPHLSEGETYDKACESAGYHFKDDEKNPKMYLPPIKDDDSITNPVVKRSVSQTIKVVNAIIREMGTSPVYINIELARELSHDLKERQKIEKEQTSNAERNESLLKRLRDEYHVNAPKGQDIVKLKLWDEQDGRCMYSGESIEIERLTEPGYVDVDHIVPYSICFDDRMANKVLVLARENRQKGNRLPMEYLQERKRDEFVIRVNRSNLSMTKKKLLLKETVSNEKEWKQRNLQDTQFISSYLRSYIDENLAFASFRHGKKRHVTAVNGAITSYVRKRWGIQKVRANGDLHHAVDATVIGCITQGMINEISRYSCFKEMEDHGEYIVNEMTGEVMKRFPTPWPHFLDELTIRMTQDEQHLRDLLCEKNYVSYFDVDLDTVKPPFVSRMCRHKSTGAAHKETVRSGRLEHEGKLISKEPLTSLKLNKEGEIADYYNPNSDRLLYEALKKRLIEFNGNGEKAFGGKPFYKPKADGTQGPEVKKVKLVKNSSANVHVLDHNGIAENDSMVRCDVFYVEGEGYYFVPIYVADTVKEKLPQYAPMQHKKTKLVDDKDFVFTLYPNDLIRICSKNEISLNVINAKSTLPEKKTQPPATGLFLYYQGMDISTAVLSGITHDNTYKFRSIGKTMQSIEKYEVDVLGNVRKIEREDRKDYSHKKK